MGGLYSHDIALHSIYHESYLFIFYLILFVCLFVYLMSLDKYEVGLNHHECNYPSISKYYIPIPFLSHHSQNWMKGPFFRTQTWYKQWFSASRFPSTSPWKMYSHQISIQLCAPSSFQFLEKPDWECCMYIYIYIWYIWPWHIYRYTYLYIQVCVCVPQTLVMFVMLVINQLTRYKSPCWWQWPEAQL